ncbi:MAG: hypothetical protein RJA86_1260, partial [Pseudomonadota bacterium]
IDIWALGVTTFALVYLRLPFTGSKNNYYDLISNIMSKSVVFPEDREVSPELKDLINKMLVKDPQKRATRRNTRWHSRYHDYSSR